MLPDTTPQSRTRSLFRSPRMGLFLLLCFHLGANIWWLNADNHAIRTDEETHMIMARDYYNAFFPRVGDRSLSARLHAASGISTDVGNPLHPPLLHVAGAVLTRVIGYGVDRLAFVNTLAFLAAVVGLYLLVRRFLDGWEAFFAALVFSFTPMVYAASRYFMTDFLSMALVIWAMYALARSRGFTSLRWSVLFAVLNGLAILARTTVVLYYFIPALVVFAAGAYFVFRHGEDRRFSVQAAASLVANALLVVIVTAAVCGPWYAMHGRQFYQYWMKSDKGAALAVVRYETPGTGDSDVARRDANAPGPETATSSESGAAEAEQGAAAAAAGQTPQAGGESGEPGQWRLFLQRRVPWIRYPVFVINNGVFLPMFGMFLLGAAVCACCRRFRRSAEAWLLLCWVLGAYVLLTLVLSFATARYALQALPALAVVSAFPVLALPKGWLRIAAQLLFTAVLLFQYGNLTVHAYGGAAELKVPVSPDPEFQEIYDDHGLYVYKPVLHGSFSYGRMRAPMKENFKDRLFFSMLKAEQERPYYGIEANYVRLNIRGMTLDEEHFWLDSPNANPFRRKDVPAELTPYRNLRSCGWGREIENILPVLPLVDYVAYTTEGITPEKEQAWLNALGEQGYELVERFHEERFGMVPARYFGLLARNTTESLPAARTPEAFQALELEDLYKVRHSAIFRGLAPDAQTALAGQMRARLEQLGSSVPLKDHVDFYNAGVEHDRDDVYKFTLVLYNRQAMPIDYRVLLQGRVSPENMAIHFNDRTGREYEFQLGVDPAPPTRLWPENEVVMLRFLVDMFPVPCQVRVALYEPGGSIRGNIINLGRVDFAALRHAGP